jgi:hypothetical protein
MLWAVIDSLKSSDLRSRASELEETLGKLSDRELVEIHAEAESAFKLLFKPETYYLYCAVFDGEVNGMGLFDFCTNLMLAGRQVFLGVSENPDHFAEIPDVLPFNDEYLSVDDMALRILMARHREEKTWKMLPVSAQSEIWKDLKNKVGPLTMIPDWKIVRETMPRVYSRWGKTNDTPKG